LNLYVTDANGRISGFPNGVLRTDIPEVSVNTFRLSDGTYWTELAYPSNRDFRIILKGTGNGSAKVYSGFKMQADPASRSIYRYSLQVGSGQEYVLNQQSENMPVKMANAAKTEISGSKITSITDQGQQAVTTTPVQEVKIFDNGNIYGVKNGPTSPTQFVLSKTVLITRIENYHYFNNGTLPGKITLVNEKGQKFGPWQAAGTPGQGGVQNAYWVVRPNISLPAGTYTVMDSDPATWSNNSQSANKGFTTVWAAGK
jgi:hypothetical protein